jgi:hypothetical protein
MKREHLIWFAAGAAASSLAFVLATIAVAARPVQVPLLAVEERVDHLAALTESEWRDVGALNGKLIHQCGARASEMDSITPDGGGQARVPITLENSPAINCIIREGAKQGFHLSVIYSPKLRVQQK